MAEKVQNVTGTLSTVTVVGQRDTEVSLHDRENTALITPDQYFLERLEIISNGTKVNLKPIVVEISYYEDLFRSTVTGHVLVSDSSNLLEKLNMCGNEFLIFSFRKGQNSETKIEKYFRIYRVGERRVDDHLSETYALHFCSEELMLSEQIKISKAYRSGSTVAEIVKSILQDDLKVQPDRINVENTNGGYDFIVPYKKPFETINWLCNYALPQQTQVKKTGSDFVFFENKDGFNFVSLQSLFSADPYNTYNFTFKNLGVGENYRTVNSFKSYTFLDTFDTLYGTTMGCFANRLVTVDPMLQTFRKTDFDYLNYTQNSINLGDNPVINDMTNRLGKKQNESYDAVYKVMISNKDQKKAKYIVGKEQGVANDINAELTIPNRTAQMSLAHYTRIKLTISGDPNLAVGKTITLIFPSVNVENKQNLYQNDAYYSGDYLITSVRHIVDINMRYETVLEVVSNGRNKNLPQFDKSDRNTKNAIDGLSVVKDIRI